MSKPPNSLPSSLFEDLFQKPLTPLDLLPSQTKLEKLLDLVLTGLPAGPSQVTDPLKRLTEALKGVDTKDLNVVVFGGGTGLSTIIGGDSQNKDWPQKPFSGLKEIFPNTRAIVCVTDDGGSTGELLKDLPIIGLGDLRHVLLSSLRKEIVQESYNLREEQCLRLVESLSSLFNFRFDLKPASFDELIGLTGVDSTTVPEHLLDELALLGRMFFEDPRFVSVLSRPQCLGNLFIAAAIFKQTENGSVPEPEAIRKGVNHIARLIGARKDSVLPCTTTPCRLKLMYSNGVMITGENKSAHARRGYPVDQTFVEYAGVANILGEVLAAIAAADIFIFAPGSLYTSIIPILQVPGMVQAILSNKAAVKILVANIWAQTGETDISSEDTSRRYYVSDLIKAYHRNIPGGVRELFQVVMLLGLQDIPGSIIQNYAVEGKTPIYLDRDNILKMGFIPVEANIFSQEVLDVGSLKHDPGAFAQAVQTIWAGKKYICAENSNGILGETPALSGRSLNNGELPCRRFAYVFEKLRSLKIDNIEIVADIFWRHQDISPRHLQLLDGLELIDVEEWKRCQEWDNVFSFYDPEDRFIKIRRDLVEDVERFEIAFLVALGQSLLGNYAQEKQIIPLELDGDDLGRVYQIILRTEDETDCYFSRDELEQYLNLVRMNRSKSQKNVFFRVLNGGEGFTPPGMLFGLIYAWYLDNKFASHIEYKMGISRMPVSNLVPEQVKTLARRNATTVFFRETVFK